MIHMCGLRQLSSRRSGGDWMATAPAIDQVIRRRVDARASSRRPPPPWRRDWTPRARDAQSQTRGRGHGSLQPSYYESGGQEFESLRAPTKSLISLRHNRRSGPACYLASEPNNGNRPAPESRLARQGEARARRAVRRPSTVRHPFWRKILRQLRGRGTSRGAVPDHRRSAW
jgi:hypothetical protein